MSDTRIPMLIPVRTSTAPRETRGVERAVLAGAVCLGLAAWIVGGLLLDRQEGLPPDGFRGLGYAMDLLTIVGAAALAGGLIGLAVGVARWGSRAMRSPRVVAAMAIFALVITASLALPGYVLAALGGPAAAGVCGIALPALGVYLGVIVGRPALVDESATG